MGHTLVVKGVRPTGKKRARTPHFLTVACRHCFHMAHNSNHDGLVRGVVKLNVGGVVYLTSTQTLASTGCVMFNTLLSHPKFEQTGAWPMTQEPWLPEAHFLVDVGVVSGPHLPEVFIDRDGELFKHILRFSRECFDVSWLASLSLDTCQRLGRESVFYAFPRFTQALDDELERRRIRRTLMRLIVMLACAALAFWLQWLRAELIEVWNFMQTIPGQMWPGWNNAKTEL